jgi:hypothetical protein
MKYLLTPSIFNQIAIIFWDKRWRLLQWSLLSFFLFVLLQNQIQLSTPTPLIWLTLFILFFALQLLVISSFIFFFKCLPSNKAKKYSWFVFYRTIEWCEAIIFTLLIPFPMCVYLYLIFI